MAGYVFIKTNIKISFRRKKFKFPRINMKIGKSGISPFFHLRRLKGRKGKAKIDFGGVYKES